MVCLGAGLLMHAPASAPADRPVCARLWRLGTELFGFLGLSKEDRISSVFTASKLAIRQA